MALRRGLKKLARRATGKALGRPERSAPRASASVSVPKPPPPPKASVPRPPDPHELAEPEAVWPEERQDLHRRLVAALREVYDPEIPINIFDLGLVYGIDTSAEGRVKVDLTLTSPACPMGPLIVDDTTQAVRDDDSWVSSTSGAGSAVPSKPAAWAAASPARAPSARHWAKEKVPLAAPTEHSA